MLGTIDPTAATLRHVKRLVTLASPRNKTPEELAAEVMASVRKYEQTKAQPTQQPTQTPPAEPRS